MGDIETGETEIRTEDTIEIMIEIGVTAEIETGIKVTIGPTGPGDIEIELRNFCKYQYNCLIRCCLLWISTC